MNLLFITDHLPFPPRNGITIPLANFISQLAGNHAVTILYVTDKALDDELQKQLALNKGKVTEVWVSQWRKKSLLRRIIGELSFSEAFSFRWIVDFSAIAPMAHEKDFDVIWSSGWSLFLAGPSLRERLASRPLLIAGANDSFAAAFQRMTKLRLTKSNKPIDKLYGIINLLRVPFIRRIETRLLANMDICLLQTEAERKILAYLSNGTLLNRILVVPNGVNESLLTIPFQSESDKDVLFLGELSGEYGIIVEWLIRNVWPKIREKHDVSRFIIVGANAPETLRKLMSETFGVVYRGFIDDIRDAFVGIGVMVAPVFKTYGLINKVVESMAAGVPVVGDKGSFNGIPEFVAGYHGLLVDGAEKTANAIIGLLDDYQRRMQIGRDARSLVKQHFSWESRADYVMRNIEARIARSPKEGVVETSIA
jgi:glycosyltransferase involved in cell wall biosynthesis